MTRWRLRRPLETAGVGAARRKLVAVRIRLQRKGARHMAFYRIVVADSRSPRDGRFVEQLGYYDPLKEPAEIKVDTDKVVEWMGKGARPTETVKSLFSRVGIMEIWHNVRQGKSLDDLRGIEEDARKRLEVQASMQKRKKEETKAEKKPATADTEAKAEKKPAKADEAADTGEKKPASAETETEAGEGKPAATDSEPEATAVEEGTAEPTAEPQEGGAEQEAAEDKSAEAPAEKPDEATEPAEGAKEPEPAATGDTGAGEGDDSKPQG